MLIYLQMPTAIIVHFEHINTPDITEITALSKDLGYDIQTTLNFKNHNRSFLGKGQLELIATTATELKTDFIIYNGMLSGSRIKQMEKYIKQRILSRIDIIIATFESRASTVESKLQITLAKLLYTKAKLVRMWSHLERQRGSTTSTGGPGEKQIELDKRMISARIEVIKKQLKKVEQDRNTRSVSRIDPVISIVGFANAGKSSLFNKLSSSNVAVSPQAFQTLDAIMRKINILGNTIILADTVGFVSHLPPFLVKAFRSTLDHIKQSQIIICLHDATNLNHTEQLLTWLKDYNHIPIIHAINKCDIYNNPSHIPHTLSHITRTLSHILHTFTHIPHTSSSNPLNSSHELSPLDNLYTLGLPISVHTNYNLDKLQEQISTLLGNHKLEITLSYEQNNLIQWLIKHSMQNTLQSFEHEQKITAFLSQSNYSRWLKTLASFAST